MQEGALFDSGILGTSFFWWIGQIADDSVWRDNVICAPFATEGENQGWGRRYKVRILGLHDQGETEIASKDLPWAQVMYPVTAGGFLANSGTTPNLRGGNMVFGFFMDGQAMTVPIIMGVLGNNAKNVTANTIGDDRVTNKKPGSLAVSGYAKGQKPKNAKTGSQETPPDGDLKSEHPNSSNAAAAARQRPGAKVNKYGLRPDLPLDDDQFRDAQDARRGAEERDPPLVGIEREEFVMKAVADGIKKREAQDTSADAPVTKSIATESPDVQQITAGDVKEDVLANEKVPMPIPDDPVGSAMKAIQILIDNIVQKMDTYLNAIQSYVDAVSSTVSNIEDMICSAAKKIAKYMKVIFDKMMEFVLKQINVVMSKVIGALPATLTSKFGDLKETINEMILMMYNKMFDGLADQLCQTLLDTLQPAKREQEARNYASKSTSSGGSSGSSGSVDDGSLPGRFKTKPKVPMCYAESIASTVISKNKKDITEANTNVISSLNAYVDGIQGDIDSVSATISQGQALISGGLGDSLGDFGATAESVTGGMDGMLNMMPDISGSLGAALDFKNIIMNIFPGELEPKKAINDFYQLATGGSGAAAAELPSMASLGKSVSFSGDDRAELFNTPTPPPEFLTPPKDKPPVPTTTENMDQINVVRETEFEDTYILDDGSTVATSFELI
jgi:hypothetical protein